MKQLEGIPVLTEAQVNAVANGQMDVVTGYYPTNRIFVSQLKLRDEHPKLDSYKQLAQDIATKGQLTHGLARPGPMRVVVEGEAPVRTLELCDGLQRFSVVNLHKFEYYYVQVRPLTDEEMMMSQFTLNAARVANKPIEERNHILAMMSRFPLLTQKDIAEKLSMTTSQLSQRLALKKLTPKVEKLVSEGAIPIAKATYLASLPDKYQDEYTKYAVTPEYEKSQGIAPEDSKSKPTGEFLSFIEAMKKDIAKARRLGVESTEDGEEQRIPHLISAAVAKKRWEELKLEVDTTPVSDDKYSFLSGRLYELERALQIDDETIAEKKRSQEEKSTQNAANKVKRQMAAAQEALKELQAKNPKLAEEIANMA